MMDFGLHRFLEMFEERFGRRVTTALLAMIGLAIFGVTARLIYADLLRPLYDFSLELFSSRIFPARPTPLLAAAASGSAVLIIAAAFYLYSRYRLAQWLKITLQKIELIDQNMDTIGRRIVETTGNIQGITSRLAERRPTPKQPSTPEKT